MTELKKTTFETINSLTIHGIPSLFRSKHFDKALRWLPERADSQQKKRISTNEMKGKKDQGYFLPLHLLRT